MSEMRIMYTNAQRVRVAVIKPDLIVIVEAWTNGDISNEFLNIGGYEIIERMDRTDTSGGRGEGIIIYAKKEMQVWKEAFEINFIHCIMVWLV
jgi:hypothetical protein